FQKGFHRASEIAPSLDRFRLRQTTVFSPLQQPWVAARQRMCVTQAEGSPPFRVIFDSSRTAFGKSEKAIEQLYPRIDNPLGSLQGRDRPVEKAITIQPDFRWTGPSVHPREPLFVSADGFPGVEAPSCHIQVSHIRVIINLNARGQGWSM